MSIVRYPTTKPFPFSDAVKANGFVFLSGQVAMTSDGQPLYGSVTQQTRQIMLAISDKVDATKQYDITEAVALLKELATAKFVEKR
ncbi:hypothetical protein ISX56_34610 [Serratia ureilytica]|nr:hypothetical protein [Serratia ureilytica]